MAAIEYDDISNKAIAAHLSRQDAAIANLTALLTEVTQVAVKDRAALHVQVDEIVAERQRLVQEGMIYQKAMEERMKAVEARVDLAHIRTSLDELMAANAIQLRIYRWWAKYRVRSRVAIAVTWVLTVLAPTILSILARRFGWI